MRIFLFQRGSTNMIYFTGRKTHECISSAAQAPAKIDFFHVREKIGIETAGIQVFSPPTCR